MDLQSLFSVAGKTALVTGGSRGIGEMIAAGYLANGVKVYISSRKADQCNATAARLADTYGGECISLPANLADLTGIDSLTAQLREREDHLDILVNNAGVSWGAPLDEFPEVGWDKVFDTNVKGVFFLTQRLLPLLRRNLATASLMMHLVRQQPRPQRPLLRPQRLSRLNQRLQSLLPHGRKSLRQRRWKLPPSVCRWKRSTSSSTWWANW